MLVVKMAFALSELAAAHTWWVGEVHQVQNQMPHFFPVNNECLITVSAVCLRSAEEVQLKSHTIVNIWRRTIKIELDLLLLYSSSFMQSL